MADTRIPQAEARARIHGTYPVSTALTVRDYFAGQALAGLLADGRSGIDRLVEEAFEYADAMVQQRENGGNA